MLHSYSEDALVEQPAIGLYFELDWSTVSELEEVFGANGTLPCETKGEVVLVSRLRAALERLNPALPPEAITSALDELIRDRSAMSLEATHGERRITSVECRSVRARERGGQKTERARVVDLGNVEGRKRNDKPLYQQKCSTLFGHVYASYYAGAA